MIYCLFFKIENNKFFVFVKPKLRKDKECMIYCIRDYSHYLQFTYNNTLSEKSLITTPAPKLLNFYQLKSPKK